MRAVYDTEETKRTGVLNRLIAEARNPQADVFWSGDPVRRLKLPRLCGAHGGGCVENARHASWESTLIGRAVLADRTLKFETNSQRRADELRLRVESACGDRIQHRAREHTDPLSSRLPGTHRAPQVNLPPAELEQLLLEHKQRHYADWIDHALPALDGKSPRETARTPSGRAAVDVLLKDMENREHRATGGAAFDFAEIRRRLRLE